MKKIGLFGGTFDPPHIGHIKLAETVKQSLSLDEVWYIPTYEPPHKRNAIASPQERLDMLNLLLNDQSKLQLLDIEYQLKGKSYTFNTVSHLKEKYPEIEFYFIIGGDMVDYLPKWYKINELKKLIQFVGVTRKEYEQVEDGDVIMVSMDEIPVSSTLIREQIRRGEHPDGLTEKVLQYIKEHRLYED
ncbi:nicotinate-nucleotide adenylyltransferase [Aquisalibacillus elongatus]|uniref:Probable nicotinate-nucleotide adenylyltransferase n=1 Tax=Aquisalibacillus elongatus TaxID=485577 RepID=A0A3N5BDK4_9BACI|nr:nicotinate-nucleotide adenylyltransferase [Aquisalibacillus elongatus]RPF55563.1 nicotinate-nucleotide adenylyltransferase [Aquisalibacillus elongatus]